jgi:hypothetical protein
MNSNTTGPANPPGDQRARPPRGVLQYLLCGLLLAYLACVWRHAESLMMLVNIETISPWAGLLMVTGSASLVMGVARSLYDARLGMVCSLLAAAELAIAAPQIGNWQYKLSQSMLATLLFGVAIALLGAWLAYRAARPTS